MTHLVIQLIGKDLFTGDGRHRDAIIQGVGVGAIKVNLQCAVMSLNRGAGGIRRGVQRGGAAVIPANAQAGIHRIKLIHRPRRVAAVKNIAENGMRSGRFKIIQIDGGADDAWRDRRRPGQGIGAGKVKRVRSGIQLQAAQVDGHRRAAQRDIRHRNGSVAYDGPVLLNGPANIQITQRNERGDIKDQ
ncbi:Uncharacterised protein [Salmonella enterica subsp. enterica serovar Bovismorbificans]|nr:Uncharacterised protein [Salmonella enterica subsp. enterica serovar Bovismorbificans]CNU06977.1 Uncharacterised protein [Salmonella enterica subsp. enterica serovar Bovismorbificans]CNV05610.1 Uncharacterised protein [Salmonella enterica subsp. enterica serovar Bovismorbificans]CNV12764.1 Uncharacterised protein [Salmonella enterica subsp. enterica serovar Bovismorbificans]CNV23946.1 Uncharacterised protein [Salmonella enterica subsp. enterica serovar Bovismorbificans]